MRDEALLGAAGREVWAHERAAASFARAERIKPATRGENLVSSQTIF